ncbi:MAG TPA: Rab family GTPase [Candidatus Acidoferrales bacterium]|nr:Rab family GTPase [Candidatus Acidoferrales bacterium]
MVQKKVCMLGSFSVGKTSLVRRFVESIFDEKYQTTIGVKVDKKVVQADGEEVTLVLWDLHGEDAFQKMRMSYLRGMSGYLLVVDPTRRQTLEDALSLQERVREAMGAIPSVLILNKCDLLEEWDIDLDRVSLLEDGGQAVIRASAKTGEGVEQGFSRLASAMLQSPV